MHPMLLTDRGRCHRLLLLVDHIPMPFIISKQNAKFYQSVLSVWTLVGDKGKFGPR